MLDAPLAAYALSMVLVLFLLAVFATTVGGGHRRGAPPPERSADDDPAIREARSLRAESRETKIRIEANASAGRPTEEDWLKSLGLSEKRSRDDR